LLTRAQTAVTVVHIPVIAGFPGLNDTVSADRDLTAVGAGVVIEFIAIIALLCADPEVAISTGGIQACIQTCVYIGTIPVVTVLYIFMFEPVTTEGQLTGIEAGVCIGTVSIITGLSRLLQAVSTRGKSTTVGTGVVIDVIAIVATLYAYLDDSITASSQFTGREAVVSIVGVGIIAVFYVHLDESVSTGGSHA